MRLQLAMLLVPWLLGSGCGKNEVKTSPGTAKAQTAATEKPAAEKPAADKPAADKPAAETGKAEAKPAKAEGSKGQAEAKPAKAAPTEEKRISGPVARVNGEPIDAAEYYAELDKILRRSRKIPEERLNRIKENILNRLIEQRLIAQAVRDAGVAVPDAEIAKAFDEYKKRFRTEEQFQNYLKHGNVTVEQIKNRIRRKKELEKLLEARGKLTVTDQEIQDFYEKNKRFYQQREGVHARHILVKLPKNATPDQEKKAREKIAKVQAALKAGKDFAEVAKEMSEGPSAPKGGDLGFFGRGQMVKPFEEKAFAMKPGEISEPVRTRFGLHIIQVVEKRDARQKPLDEVKDTIRESLRNKKFFQERRALLNELKAKAKIERLLQIPGRNTKAAPRATVRPAVPAAPASKPAGKPAAGGGAAGGGK